MFRGFITLARLILRNISPHIDYHPYLMEITVE